MRSLKFSRDYDYKPNKQSAVAYKARPEPYDQVPEAHAEAAIAAGAAEEVNAAGTSAAAAVDDTPRNRGRR